MSRNLDLLRQIAAAAAERPRARQRDLAVRLGVSRARVSNLQRVLKLQGEVLALVWAGHLSVKHAEALLPLPAPAREQMARAAIAHGWSYAHLTDAVDQRLGRRRRGQGSNSDVDMASLERALGEHLGTTVAIEHRPSGEGHLVLQYSDLDTLEGLLERLGYVAQ